jgi:hypothetical protein
MSAPKPAFGTVLAADKSGAATRRARATKGERLSDARTTQLRSAEAYEDPDVLLELLNSSDPAGVRAAAGSLLERIGSGSIVVDGVHHPLGFQCLPILRTGSIGACFHFWDRENDAVGRPQLDDRAHAHSWNLVSHVLHGSITNHTYEVRTVPEGTSGSARLYDVTSTGHDDDMKWTERTVVASRAHSAECRAAATYKMPAGTFHTTEISATVSTLTLVLGIDKKGYRNYLIDSRPADEVTTRRQLGSSEKVNLVKRLADYL